MRLGYIVLIVMRVYGVTVNCTVGRFNQEALADKDLCS